MKAPSVDNNRFWFTLDNAAKIFPAVISDETPVVFRLTAVLKQPVKLTAFQQAVLKTEKRFPYFKVRLKEGFFWYYLEHLPGHIPLSPETKKLCRKFSKHEMLIRVLIRENRISLEFSHILTDGGGAFEFFKTLMIEYSLLCGARVPGEFPYIKPESAIQEEECEDAYKRHFKESVPPIVKRSGAFHLPFKLNSRPRFRQSTAMLSVEEIKQLARAKQVNITVYLVAVYLLVLQEFFDSLPPAAKYRHKKCLRIQVPIDLRNILPSKSLRNFSLFLMPEIDLRLGHYSFDEIIKTVYHQMQLESDEKLISKNIARNVGSEKKIYIRAIPLFIKSAVLQMKYYSLGTRQYSGVITNLGMVSLPNETAAMIDHFIAIPPPPNKLLKLNCGIIGFGENMVLSFGNITKSRLFEEKFLAFLKAESRSLHTPSKT